MVGRRGFLGLVAVGLVGTMLPSFAQSGVDAWLATAFRALPERDRRAVQTVLVRLELHMGSVDGAPAPAWDAALARLPGRITQVTADGVTVVLDTPEDAMRFLRELAAGAWDPFLFDGWSENGQRG